MLDEQFLLTLIAPLVRADLDAQWATVLGGADASPSGYGVTVAHIGTGLAGQLESLAEKRGDYRQDANISFL